MSSSLTDCPPFQFSAKYYHEVGGSCVRQSSFFGGKALLNQGVGYSVILGFGAFFAFFTSLLVSRSVVLAFGCFMGILAVMLNKARVSIGWMYLAMGVFIGSAVLPITFMLLWRKANATGAILGTVTGCLLGIITWLTVTKVEYGRVNLDTTGRNAPMLAGNLVSILTGGAVHAVCSFVSPQDYDWETTKQITVVEKEKSELSAEEYKEEKLIKAKRWIVKWGVGFALIIVVFWPILTLPAGQFNQQYFTFWVVIAIAYGTIASAVIIAMPLMESWETIKSVLLGMFTNDRLMEEMNFKLQTIMAALPEVERTKSVPPAKWNHQRLKFRLCQSD